MKRITALITITAILSLMLVAFVQADTNTDLPQWFQDMMSWKRSQIDLAEKAGTITADQAAQYKSHLELMEKYHRENGLNNGMGLGHCSGSFGSNNTGYGFGRGMMGSW